MKQWQRRIAVRLAGGVPRSVVLAEKKREQEAQKKKAEREKMRRIAATEREIAGTAKYVDEPSENLGLRASSGNTPEPSMHVTTVNRIDGQGRVRPMRAVTVTVYITRMEFDYDFASREWLMAVSCLIEGDRSMNVGDDRNFVARIPFEQMQSRSNSQKFNERDYECISIFAAGFIRNDLVRPGVVISRVVATPRTIELCGSGPLREGGLLEVINRVQELTAI